MDLHSYTVDHPGIRSVLCRVLRCGAVSGPGTRAQAQARVQSPAVARDLRRSRLSIAGSRISADDPGYSFRSALCPAGIAFVDERSEDAARVPDLADLPVADSLPADRGMARQEGRLSGNRRLCRRSRHVLFQRRISRKLSSLKLME